MKPKYIAFMCLSILMTFTLPAQLPFLDASTDSIKIIVEEANKYINPYISTAKKKQAIEKLLLAEQFAESRNLDSLTHYVYNKKIEFYLVNHDLNAAKVYLDKSFKILKNYTVSKEFGLTYELLGIYYFYHHNLDEALNAFLKAEKILDVHAEKKDNVDINYNIALIYFNAQNWDKTIAYSKKGLKALNGVASKLASKKFFEAFLMSAYAKTNQLKLAKYYHDQVLKHKNLASLKENKSYSHHFYTALGEYYQAIGYTNKALLAFKKAQRATTKFYQNLKTDITASLALSKKVEHEYLEKKRLLAVKALSKNKAKYNTNVAILAVILILTLLTICIIQYRTDIYKSKTNSILKESYNKVLKANETTEKALKARSDFLKTVTHELKTPLSSIMGIAYILNKTELNKELKPYVNTLKFSSNYLANLVNNIIDLNLHTNKTSHLNFKTVNIKQVLNNIISLYRVHNCTNNNTFNYKVDTRIPEYLILDDSKLTQVIVNLLDNAFKFTKKGVVNFKVELIEEFEKEVEIKFIIKDSGIGIPKENFIEIFEAYKQGNSSISKKYGGSGIGLSVCKNIIELYGSRIYIESKEGKGTKMTFSLTLKRAIDVPITIKKETLNKWVLNQKNILLVEDNKVSQSISKKILTDFGFNCTTANSGVEAISIFKKNKFDLVITDIFMPNLDGFEMSKIIRKINPNIKIIALTGLNKEFDDTNFISSGISKMISKPAHPEILFKTIIEVLNLNPTALMDQKTQYVVT